MAGITAFGAYIPPTRLPLAHLAGRPVKEGGPEKAVAWNDEDSVTMAVTAATDCLSGMDRACVDGVLFASTTHAFREKQAAALIARALDLRGDVRTADYSGSLRAGLSALRGALDAVSGSDASHILVIASDCRMAAPGSALEANFGDAAVAFLVGRDDPIATLEDSHAVSEEIVDVWRSEGDPFVHSWEERFVVQEGYLPQMASVVQGTLEKTSSKLDDYARVALYAPDARSHSALARQLGASAETLQDPLFRKVGNCGVAFAPLLLASALEEASANDRILAAGYGDGAEAMTFRKVSEISSRGKRLGVRGHLSRRRTVASYDRYLKARSLTPQEWNPGADPGLSATVHFRERDEDLGLKGQRCLACDKLQFPCQRVCENCFEKDRFDRVRLSDRQGRIVTYTFDYFFPNPDPPTIVTVTDIDGARVHLQLVDCSPEDTRIGLPVEFVFRRIHEGGGRPNYYWKGRPADPGGSA
ncbi:MAG: OB-fold domain-containing protein [Myxococcota bacterium]|nr:OB-fold domain-containing protein [Myxococcota bacterium]